MSGVSTEQVNQLNNRVKALNSERHRLIGSRDSAQAEFDRLRMAYSAKYGVNVEPATLQEEYNKVFAEVQGAFLDVEEKVKGIEQGNYKTASTVPAFNPNPDVEPIRAEKPVEQPVQPASSQPTTPAMTPDALAQALTMQATPVQPPEQMKEFLTPEQVAPPVASVTPEPPQIETPPVVQAMTDSAVSDKLAMFGGMMQEVTTEQQQPQTQSPPTWGNVDTDGSLNDTFKGILNN